MDDLLVYQSIKITGLAICGWFLYRWKNENWGKLTNPSDQVIGLLLIMLLLVEQVVAKTDSVRLWISITAIGIALFSVFLFRNNKTK